MSENASPEPKIGVEWWDLVRQLAMCARAGACANRVMTVTVLTDRDGVPVVWTTPKVTRLQPGREAVQNWLEILEKESVSTRFGGQNG